MISFIASAIFVLGYIGIAMESTFRISKAAFALITGAVLWTMVAIAKPEILGHEIAETGGEIFGLIGFLLAAMSLVEILLHYRFFDVIRGKLFALKVGERAQLVIVGGTAFLLSAVIDNLTTSIVMTQISTKFFKGQNLLKAVVLVVIAANAGGSFSPIGDITTIMLWLAGKFGTLEIIYKAFLPALALFGVSAFLIARTIKKETQDITTEIVQKLHPSEKFVIAITFAAFLLPLTASLMGLPPYMGLLFGLGVVWLTVDLLKHGKNPRHTHLQASIEEFIKRIDIASIKFFMGILLAVSALNAIGVLENVSHMLYGQEPSLWRMVGANAALGMLSAIVDNIPLTAIAIDIMHTPIDSLWILLALTVGTGGSLLVIGSAAGVIAMGMVKELTFMKYFRIAFIPALLGFFAAIGVWLFEFFFLGW
ncbi:MAG: sodium:proton antiporter NhaD [Candidatus Wildermuthbacteria bacterium]|nr:sodium:proton antiporter NhaD [Candidatus Wildermuthbacteria bacterium]